MTTKSKLRPGARVHVFWGLATPRAATVLEVWGDPAAPSHVRVELDPFEAGEEASVLLLNPKALVETAA